MSRVSITPRLIDIKCACIPKDLINSEASPKIRIEYIASNPMYKKAQIRAAMTKDTI